jgi:hypothetical protein
MNISCCLFASFKVEVTLVSKPHCFRVRSSDFICFCNRPATGGALHSQCRISSFRGLDEARDDTLFDKSRKMTHDNKDDDETEDKQGESKKECASVREK